MPSLPEFDVDNPPKSGETGRSAMGTMGRRVVASYCSSFLKSEMWHIYRQVKALRGVKTFVVTKEVQNAERFPFDDIEVIPKRRTNLLVHGWLKFVKFLYQLPGSVTQDQLHTVKPD